MTSRSFNRIICPVDTGFSATSVVAARMAVKLAHATGASVVFVVVVRLPGTADNIVSTSGPKAEFENGRQLPGSDADPGQVATTERELWKRIDEIRSPFPEVRCSTEIRSGDVGPQIIEAVDTHDADMICMATRRGSSIARSLLGSVTDHVVGSSSVPMLLMHPDSQTRRDESYFEGWPSAVIVPLDGSRLGETAIPIAVSLARLCAIPIRLVHGESLDEQTPFMMEASESPYWPEDGERVMGAARHYVDSVRDSIVVQRVECTSSVVDLSSTHAIIDACQKEEHPLIVMSSHGRSGIRRLVLGSVSDEVIRNSGESVIVIPPGRD